MQWTKEVKSEYNKNYHSHSKWIKKYRKQYNREYSLKKGYALRRKYYAEGRYVDTIKKWQDNNIDRIKMWRRLGMAKRRAFIKSSIPIEDIQALYENNIKKYGTLTCYLCNKPVEFGMDSIDHKTPLSRGGLHSKKNIGIAHIGCNCRKKDRTVSEYLTEMKRREHALS